MFVGSGFIWRDVRREGGRGEREEIKGSIFKDISNLSPLLGTEWLGPGVRVSEHRPALQTQFRVGFPSIFFFFFLPDNQLNELFNPDLLSK